MPAPASIHVEGNVAGSIVLGDNNLVVHTNYGSIFYQQAAPRVKLRNFAPQPPRPPRGFVNRHAEMAQLQTWLAANEIIVLYAPDGVGKTALLRQAANSPAARAFPNGVIFLESSGADSPALGEDLIQQIFDSLFESDPPLKVTALSARTYLSNTRPLLVLDEVPLNPALQRSLPDLFPQAAILLSADTFTASEYQHLRLGSLPRAEAAQLLAAQAGLPPSAELENLCEALGNVSLAVLLTANWLRETGHSPQQALQTLQGLQSQSANPQQAALDKAYLLLWNGLTEEERRLLSAAAFAPGVSNAPAWFQAALGGEIQPALQRLQTLGLLFANSPRLRLPPGLRPAARRLAWGSEAEWLPRLTGYLLQGAAQGMTFVRQEQGNFWGAIAWSAAHQQPAQALELIRALNPMLILSGQWEAWQFTLQTALTAALESGNLSAQAWVWHEMGTRLLALGDKGEAAKWLRRALSLREQLGETQAAAYTRHNLNLLAPPPAPAPPKKISWGWLAAGGLTAVLLLAAWLAWVWLRPAPSLPAQTRTPSQAASLTPRPTLSPPPSLTPGPDVQAPALSGLQFAPAETFYGEGVEACALPGTLTLSFIAQDTSALTRLELRYRYQSGQVAGEWQSLSLPENALGQYQVNIQNNQDSQALGALDGLDGEVVWQVLARDAAGNEILKDGSPAPVFYSRCESTPPTLSGVDFSPSPAVYGDVSLCSPGLYTTETRLYVAAMDESGLKRVYAQYFYRRDKTKGPLLEVTFTSPNQDSYFIASIDHNFADQAQKVLKGLDGALVLQIFAEDIFGNLASGNSFEIPVEYHFCPPPG